MLFSDVIAREWSLRCEERIRVHRSWLVGELPGLAADTATAPLVRLTTLRYEKQNPA